MSYARAFCVILLCVTLPGCVSYLAGSPIPLDGQETMFVDGKQLLVSNVGNSVAMGFQASPPDGGRGVFVVAVQNGIGERFDFSTDNIAAAELNSDGSVKQYLPVFSYEDLVAEERKRQTWAAVGAALVAHLPRARPVAALAVLLLALKPPTSFLGPEIVIAMSILGLGLIAFVAIAVRDDW